MPDGKNPQAFNRYAYGLNNPVKYTDPTGHYVDEGGHACYDLGCDYDPTSEGYEMRYGPGSVHVDTYFLSPAESQQFFGVAVPQRVDVGTVVGLADPNNVGMLIVAIAAALVGGIANLPMPQGFLDPSPTYIEGNPNINDVFPEPFTDPESGTGNSDGFHSMMEPSESERYDAYWQRPAPKQVEPGTRRMDWTRQSDRTGRLESSRAIYDDYGRITLRVDYTDHMRPIAHSNPHLHEFEYGPGYTPYRQTSHNLIEEP